MARESEVGSEMTQDIASIELLDDYADLGHTRRTMNLVVGAF